MSKVDIHRNALGYVICADAARLGTPSIVWGKRSDGGRVFIDQADRGAAQGLRCECGSELVAKKGNIKAWHFAHRATGLSRCAIAFAQALGQFAAGVIRKGGIWVPTWNSSCGPYNWQPDEITFKPVAGGVLLRTAKAVRHLDIYVVSGEVDLHGYLPVQIAADVSALSVVLGDVRNSGDDILAQGIRSECKRTWLFNRLGSDAKERPEQSLAGRLEAMFPAEQERRRLQLKHRKKFAQGPDT
jgi:hypothetical protein